MKTIFIFLLAFVMTACSDSSDKSSGGSPATPTNSAGGPHSQMQIPVSYVDWEGIDKKYNPSTVEHDVQFDDAEAISLHIAGFDKDVRIFYTGEVRNIARVVTYGVSSFASEWGMLYHVKEKTRVGVYNYNNFSSCEISVSGRRITSLEGKCYVRIEIYMPLESKVKIYNAGVLLTPQ